MLISADFRSDTLAKDPRVRITCKPHALTTSRKLSQNLLEAFIPVISAILVFPMATLAFEEMASTGRLGDRNREIASGRSFNHCLRVSETAGLIRLGIIKQPPAKVA